MLRNARLKPLAMWLAAALTATAPASSSKSPRINVATVDSSAATWQLAFHQVGSPSQTEHLSVPARLCHGSRDEKLLALTFDDGPHPIYTEKLLAVLRAEHVRASFFVVGKMAERNPELLREEAADGHLIANHTFSHVTMTRIPENLMRTEYQAGNDAIQKITGERPRFCRPPGGDFDPEVIRAAQATGLTTVMWTDDPGDYASPGTEVIEKRTLDSLRNGGIILLHDGIQQTIDVLPDIIRDAHKLGYRFVTVDELMHSNAERRPSILVRDLRHIR